LPPATPFITLAEVGDGYCTTDLNTFTTVSTCKQNIHKKDISQMVMQSVGVIPALTNTKRIGWSLMPVDSV
jgi:hypothetical protein